MAKRKNKKLARLKKTIFIFLFSTIYLFINIILFFGSFRFLNMKSITVNNVIYMFILSFVIGMLELNIRMYIKFTKNQEA